MQNITPQEAYAALFRELCRYKRLSYIDWKAFMDRTEMVQFKANEVVIQAGTPSTHSYFIIKGLMMCYHGDDPKKSIWFRAEQDYAFTVDKFSFGEKGKSTMHRLVGEEAWSNMQSVVALEDTLAFSLSHENFLWLSAHLNGFDLLNAGLLLRYSMKIKQISNCVLINERDRYEWIQEVHGFRLDRIPGTYLAGCIGVTQKRLKELQKDNRISFLTRY